MLTIHPGWRNRDGSNALESLAVQMNQCLGLAVPDGFRGPRKGWRKPMPTSSRRVTTATDTLLTAGTQ